MRTKSACLLIAILSIAWGVFETFLCKMHHRHDLTQYYFLESSIWYIAYLILDEKQNKTA